jgi:hypothetical protein
MRLPGWIEWLTVALMAMMLAGCGGGGSSDPGPGPGNGGNDQRTIGGTLSGLSGTVVLQNNGGNNLSLSANGPFTFTTALANGAAYNVTVLTQPAGQTCNVTNGGGTASANVSNVTVSCTNNPTSVTIGGTVTGLTAGTLVLQNNLGDNLSVTSGTFTFPTAIAVNSPYFVSVLIQPATETCTVTANGSGSSATNVTNVQIACVDNATTTVTVGGQVSGLGGGVLTLRNGFLANNVVTTNDLQITSNGTFTFPAMPTRSFFSVTVLTQPVGQTCSVFANAGVPIANVTNVVVDCQNATTVHTVGGTITGLTKSGLILTLSANNNILVVPANASTFTFPVGLVQDTDYLVGIAVQPQGMTCVATNIDGNVGTANVTDVAIACINNTTDPLLGTYKVVGINDYITFYPDGTYVLASRENDPSCGTSNGNGVELGIYNYNNTTGGFAVVSNAIDTNDECGLWGSTGISGTVQKSGVGQGSSLTFNDGTDTFTLVPAASVANTFIGSFRQPSTPGFIVFGDDGHYTVAHTGNDSAGIEYGCYVMTGTTSGTITPDVTPATCPGTVDTNDDAGLSDADGMAIPYTVLNPYVVQAVDRMFFRIVPN